MNTITIIVCLTYFALVVGAFALIRMEANRDG
jgi:hypothetical protein